jgi:hypothetical protein
VTKRTANHGHVRIFTFHGRFLKVRQRASNGIQSLDNHVMKKPDVSDPAMIGPIAGDSSTLHNFIDHELEHTFSGFAPGILSQLSAAAKQLLHGLISFQAAQDVFSRCAAGISLLHKIQQILNTSDGPLPPRPESNPSNQNGSRRKGFPWTDVEDVRLLVAVSRYGAKDWRAIADFVGSGRTSSQCNQRWCRALDPAISHRPWNDADDTCLLRAVEVLGRSSWCQVAQILTGRTDLQCRYRYLQLAKMTAVAEKIEPEPAIPEPPPVAPPPLDQVAKKRRNSISIAFFTGEMDLDKLTVTPPVQMLPYYLESSLTPRNDPNQQYLHRVPPLLFMRPSKKEGT